jgi:hypothetical protein
VLVLALPPHCAPARPGSLCTAALHLQPGAAICRHSRHPRAAVCPTASSGGHARRRRRGIRVHGPGLPPPAPAADNALHVAPGAGHGLPPPLAPAAAAAGELLASTRAAAAAAAAAAAHPGLPCSFVGGTASAAGGGHAKPAHPPAAARPGWRLAPAVRHRPGHAAATPAEAQNRGG